MPWASADECIRCRSVLPAGPIQVEPGTPGPSCEACQPAFEAAHRAAQEAQLRRHLRGVLTPGTVLPQFGSRSVCVLGLDLWETWSELRLLELDPIGVLRGGVADARDALLRWDATDDLGTRYWGFTTGFDGPMDTRRITSVDLFPAIRDVARRLHLMATYDGATREAIVDLTALRRPQPSPKVHTEPLAPVDRSTCRQCAAEPAEGANLCPSCRTIWHAAIDRRHAAGEAQPRFLPLAVRAGEVLGGPFTVLAIETLPNSFVLRFHHDISWRVDDGVWGSLGHPTTWGRWEITDDRGATYPGANVGGHASPHGWWGDVWFGPALHTEATHLRVRLIATGRRLLTVDVSVHG